MAHKSTNAYRFFDIAGVSMRKLPPLRGFENAPLVSFEQAIEPLIPHVPEIERMVDTIKNCTILSKTSLSTDESLSIALYSMEWNPLEKSFSSILNETLRDPKRETLLPSWFKFLRLFLTGLSKISWTDHRTIFRGVKLDLRSRYKEGARIVWWGFPSCTKIIGVEKEQFVGKSGTRTLFTIECNTEENIREHSFFTKEDEILLPGREFEVITSADMGKKLSVIQFKGVQPQFPNIAWAPSPSLVVSTPTGNTASGTAATPKVIASAVQPKQAPRPKPTIKPVKVSYREMNLTNNEIPRVIKEALEQQQYTELDLFVKKITHEGDVLLPKALKSNKVRKSFDLFLCIESRHILSLYMNKPFIKYVANR